MKFTLRSVSFAAAIVLSGAAVAAPGGADITITPPANGGFVIKNNAGNAERLRVMETGDVYLPNLSNTTEAGSVACYDDATGGWASSRRDCGEPGSNGSNRSDRCHRTGGRDRSHRPGRTGGPHRSDWHSRPSGPDRRSRPHWCHGPSRSDGAQGDIGLPGPTGPAGPAGASGGKAIMSSSAKGMALTTIAGGLPGNVAVLPMNGYVPAAAMQSLIGGNLDLTAQQAADGVPQSFPADGVITGLTAQIQNTSALSLVGTTISLQAQLYTSVGNVFSPVPGAVCTMAPSYTGILTIGTISSCIVTGLSIPVTSGTRGVL